MLGRAFWLLLGDKASLISRQRRIDDIIWNIVAQFNSTSSLTGEVLLELLTGVDEPKILCAALHVLLPASGRPQS